MMTFGVTGASARRYGIRGTHTYCEQVKPGNADAVLQRVIVLLCNKRIGVADPRVLLRRINNVSNGSSA